LLQLLKSLTTVTCSTQMHDHTCCPLIIPKIITMKLTVNCRFTQLISLLILFVLPEIGMSQDQDIDSCTSAEVVDVDHQKAMDFYFKHNINISAYDWSNTNVNCHIALGYKS